MKGLKTYQKIGLISAIVGALALSPFAIKKNSGLEGKLITAGMSTANAMGTNEKGYEVPNLEGRTPQPPIEKEDEGIKYQGEIFLNVNGQGVIRLSRNGNVFAYIIDQEMDGKLDYVIQDNDGDGVFESKYDGENECIKIPGWVR